MTYTQLHCSAPSLDRHVEKENHSVYGSHKAHEQNFCSCVIVDILNIVLYRDFSGVSGAVIRSLSQWQMPTFFSNLNKKSQSEGHFYVNQYSLQIAFIFNGLLIKIKYMIRNKSDSMQLKRPCLRKYYKN